MTAVEASGLSKTFGNVKAVRNVSFEVEKGEFFGFLGPNGAGKTTTIRMLTGLITPDSGKALIDGIDPQKDPIHAKMKMGVIPEFGNVYVDLTAKENLHLAGKFYGMSKKEREERASEILHMMELKGRENDAVRNFSKGMKQRVNIGCAIIHEPPVLFLDEPTSGLDVQSKRLVVRIVTKMKEKGSTIFLTTHNIQEANELCERVGIIHKGDLVAIDRPEKLRNTFDKTQSIEVSIEGEFDVDMLHNDHVNKIERSGDKLTLFTDHPDITVKRLVKLTDEEDLKILSLRTQGPSLEEAFVRLTGGNE
ncbi:MAG: ATP-binding cassette domain-containing protein [Candidatus Thermoplasmatota archaeon]|nr:ATP-binding cassette domain-containing protein [Candidatus Thermoplasmatota archaeon]